MTEPLLPRHREKILHARAISDEVIDSWPQRYQSFEAGDSETFFRLMQIDLSKLKPGTVSSYKGKVTQTGGIVVTRHAINEGLVVTEGNEPTPYARLDQDVWMGRGDQTHYLRSPDESDTKRLDMHPSQPGRRINFLGRGADAFEPVDAYLCLEGSLKADAVLSAGFTTFSSTSVTTWKGDDLKRLLPKLRQVRTVYVVPDSDYMASDKFIVDGEVYFNPSVMYQTKMAAQWLAERKVNAKIAVPWAEEARGGTKLGIDDYLALGYSMKDLRIVTPYADYDPIQQALNLTKKERQVLDALLRVYGDGVRGAFRPKKVASRLKLGRSTVLRAYKHFEELGIMRVWEGWAHKAADGRYYNDPHWYVAFRLLNTYGDWLRAQPIPARVTRVMLERSLRCLPGWRV